MRSRRPSCDWPLFFATALLVLLADLLSKHMVLTGAWSGEYLGGLLCITRIGNPGAAFGLFPGAHAIFIVIKILALAGILIVLARGEAGRRAGLIVPLAMIFGGALGNLIDRVRNNGEVIDFLDIGLGSNRWYVFNVADASISIGALLVVLALLRGSDPRTEAS